MNEKEKELFEKILIQEIDKNKPHNIRENGQLVSRVSTKDVEIISKEGKAGININIKDNIKTDEIQIPVLLTLDGIEDTVYNDFNIGENCEATILAGCAIHNDCEITSIHSGIHTFNIKKNSKVKYVEKHYGCGQINGNKSINTLTIVNLEENAELIIDTIQISGVDEAVRETKATLKDNSSLIINEKLMTAFKDKVKTSFVVNLNGKNSKINIVSKSIAKDDSKQIFISKVKGNSECFGHIECDAILLGNAKVSSTPTIYANHPASSLTHEAAIGKIASEQLLKLMTLGLTEKEAENEIIKGFLN